MPQKCSGCGTEIPDGSKFGACPKCLLAVGLEAGGRNMPAAERVKLESFGDYELLEEIARGGMGVVYKARQKSLNRLVAVKMILFGPKASADFIKRFRIEASSAAALQHPNIVAIHEVGVHDGEHFLVMDYVEGPNLAQLAKDQPLSAERAARYLRKVAEAIHHAHEKGILHRDLKPSNVLIDSNDEPRVTDFGLAKRLGTDTQPSTDFTELTLSGHVLGSPGYMPPEQAIGARGRMSRRSDIYSMGAMLYHLLTGRAPFGGNSMADVLYQVQHQEPVPPRLVNPAVPLDLETICLKCLEKEPERRYRNARELAEELARFAEGEPIHARPISGSEKVWRWCRRRPALAASIVLVHLTIIAGVVGVISQRRAEQKSAESREHLARLHIADGLRLEEQGDVFAALPWFTEALRLSQDATPATTVDRLRLGSILHRAPRLVSLWSHDGGLFWTVFSQDARYVLIITEKDARIFDAATGKPVSRAFSHDDTIDSAEFSRDGRLLVTSDSHTVQVWSMATGDPVGPRISVKTGGVDPRFSPDGSQLAVRSGQTNALILSVTNGQPLTPPLSHEPKGDLFVSWARGNVRHVAFAPDGKAVATASRDGTARVWDTVTGLPLTPPLRHDVVKDGWVDHLSFSPDGRRLATAGSDGLGRIWDVKTGNLLLTLSHEAQLTRAEFSPSGQHVATAAWDGTVCIWDAETGRRVGPILKHVEKWVRHLTFAPDRRRILAAGLEAVSVWEVGSGEQSIAPLLHQRVSGCPAFTADSRSIRIGSQDGRIQTWDLALTALYRRTLRGPKLDWRFADVACDRVLTVGPENEARVWGIHTGQLIGRPLSHTQDINHVAFSLDGQRVATCSGDSLQVWDIGTGRTVTAPVQHSAKIRHIAFSHDRRWIITASEDGTARVWDATTGQAAGPALRHGGRVRKAEFSHDDRFVVTCSDDRTAVIWDATNGERVGKPLQHQEFVISAEFSSNGEYVITASSDNTAQIWSTYTHRRKGAVLRHSSSVVGATFSPNSRLVATTSLDGTARVWDAETGEPVTPPLQHGDYVYHPTWHSNSQLLMTIGKDRVHIWDVARGQLLVSPIKGHRAWWSSDGQEIVTIGDAVRIWRLTPDNRPIDDLILFSQLYSGSHIDKAGGLSPLESPTHHAATAAQTNLISVVREFVTPGSSRRDNRIVTLWNKLRDKYPQDFEVSREAIVAWHEREVAEAEHQNDSFGAAFHLQVLKQLESTNLSAASRSKEVERESKTEPGARAGAP